MDHLHCSSLDDVRQALKKFQGPPVISDGALTLSCVASQNEFSSCVALLAERNLESLRCLRVEACFLGDVDALGAAVSRCNGAGTVRCAKADDANAASESAHCQLESLAVVHCPRLESAGWCRFFRTGPWNVARLDFSGNALVDRTLDTLCGMLKGGLTHLILARNRLKDIGRLCQVIQVGDLLELDLSDNALNDKSVGQLGKALCHPRTSLQSLSLAWNPKVTSSKLQVLVHSRLRVLLLSGTAVCDKSAPLFEEQNSLEEIHLDMTRITTLVARRLIQVAESSALRKLVVEEGGQCIVWERCLADLLLV